MRPGCVKRPSVLRGPRQPRGKEKRRGLRPGRSTLPRVGVRGRTAHSQNEVGDPTFDSRNERSRVRSRRMLDPAAGIRCICRATSCEGSVFFRGPFRPPRWIAEYPLKTWFFWPGLGGQPRGPTAVRPAFATLRGPGEIAARDRFCNAFRGPPEGRNARFPPGAMPGTGLAGKRGTFFATPAATSGFTTAAVGWPRAGIRVAESASL